MALQNFKLDSMKVFLDEVFYIPNYQREYSWELSHLEDFWQDLTNLLEDITRNVQVIIIVLPTQNCGMLLCWQTVE